MFDRPDSVLLQRILPPTAESGPEALLVAADGARGGRASYASYFNAFPASYWRHWTRVREVSLELSTSGSGRVVVSASNADGVARVITTRELSGRQDDVTSVVIPLDGFDDGGWLWFEVQGDTEAPLVVAGGWYSVRSAGAAVGSATIAITTLNREDYCTKVLLALADASETLEVVDRVLVVDQGDNRVREHPSYPEAAERLGERLTVIEQDNLGGSGGFSRGMLETLQRGESDYVILLDDDVELQPESIRRLVVFADHLRAPAIVGGHMLDLNAKTTLHAFAESIDKRRFMWGASVPGTDFAVDPLPSAAHLHRRAEADYNGWWMCLIPVSVLRMTGLSLPLFIKWDDAEFGLRAAAAGVPTVTLPGAAVWHVSWVDKTDSVDWQAFYHARNRLIAALLHHGAPRGGTLLVENLLLDVKYLLSMQYYAAAARFAAYRSVLAGPGALDDDLASRRALLRQMTARYPDAVPIPSGPAAGDGGESSNATATPHPLALLRILIGSMIRNAMVPARLASAAPPRVRLSAAARWWAITGYDSVLVSRPNDAHSAFWYRRDRRLFRSGIRESLRCGIALLTGWQGLSGKYKGAADELRSPEAWNRRFTA